jgi:hypothetical protein
MPQGSPTRLLLTSVRAWLLQLPELSDGIGTCQWSGLTGWRAATGLEASSPSENSPKQLETARGATRIRDFILSATGNTKPHAGGLEGLER